MNYLAHLFLSGNDEQMMVGGLLGDFVKGVLKGERPERIEQGILLHRRIDAHCQRIEGLRTALQRFDSPWRRYAGIILDICCDHFLARDWGRYHPLSLGDYCRAFYASLARYHHLLPPGAQRFCQVAPQVCWLEGYAERRHMPEILDRVGQRLQRPVALGRAVSLIDHDYALMRDEFHEFFPELIDFAQHQRLQMGKLVQVH